MAAAAAADDGANIGLDTIRSICVVRPVVIASTPATRVLIDGGAIALYMLTSSSGEKNNDICCMSHLCAKSKRSAAASAAGGARHGEKIAAAPLSKCESRLKRGAWRDNHKRDQPMSACCAKYLRSIPIARAAAVA